MCDQSDKNVQLPVRPRGLIDVRRKFNLLLHPIVICRLTVYTIARLEFSLLFQQQELSGYLKLIRKSKKLKAIHMFYSV